MKSVSVCVLAAAAAVLWAATARAQSPARPATFAAASAANVKRLAPEQRDEWRFLKEAAAGSRFETEASKLALARSNNPNVRNFAATLLNHHAAAASVLQHMLHVRNMAPPMLSNDQRKTLNRLAKLHGGKFDREYMDEVGLRMQQEELQTFERASVSARDPALKSWVDATLPTLRFHLSTAERLVNGNTRLVKTAPASTQLSPREPLATQFMGAGPASMQLGPAPQPVVARPTAPSTR